MSGPEPTDTNKIDAYERYLLNQGIDIDEVVSDFMDDENEGTE